MFKDKSSDENFSCSCQKCVLYYHRNKVETYNYLVVNGIMLVYDNHIIHGESISISNPTTYVNVKKETYIGDDIMGMLHDTSGMSRQVIDIDMNEKILT